MLDEHPKTDGSSCVLWHGLRWTAGGDEGGRRRDGGLGWELPRSSSPDDRGLEYSRRDLIKESRRGIKRCPEAHRFSSAERGDDAGD